MVRPDVAIFWGWDAPASSRLLLTVVTKWVDSACERVDSACERETCYEFAWWVKVVLLCVVALATYCSTRDPSTVDLSLGVGWAGGITILSNNCLMVWMAWLVSSTIPSSWACRLATWARSTTECSATFSFPGLWGGFEAWVWFWLSKGWFWARCWEQVLLSVVAVVCCLRGCKIMIWALPLAPNCCWRMILTLNDNETKTSKMKVENMKMAWECWMNGWWNRGSASIAKMLKTK